MMGENTSSVAVSRRSDEGRTHDGRRIRVDLAATAGAHAAYKVAGLAILVVLTRTLAKDSLGLFLFASSLVALVSPLAELGLNTLLVRDVAVAPEHAAARLRRVLRLRAGLLALAAAALTAGTAIVRPPLTGVIALLAVGGAFDELAMTFGAYFVGLRRARINAVLGVGGKALLVALVAAAALWTRELTIVLVAVAAANAARLAASMIVAQRIGFRWRGAATDEIHRPPAALGHEVRGDARSPVEGTAAVRLPGAREAGIPSPSDETPRALVHRALPLFALGALASVHLRGDAALLGWLASYTAVATYGATFRLLEAAQFVTRPLGVVFLPLFASRMAAGERAWVGAQFRRLLALAVGAGIAGAALVFVAAGWFVPLLFGASYADCVPVMRILYLALPGFLTIVVCGTAVRALKREREAIVISVACAAVGFGAKAIAIPAAGVMGVAWCTVAMFTLQGLLLARCVRAAIAESPIGAEAAAAATPTSNQPAATNPVDAQALAADPEARVAI